MEAAVGRILDDGSPSPENLAEIEDAIAAFHGLSPNDLARISSALGEVAEPAEGDGE